jgi:DNA polymerase III subunit epsilon
MVGFGYADVTITEDAEPIASSAPRELSTAWERSGRALRAARMDGWLRNPLTQSDPSRTMARSPQRRRVMSASFVALDVETANEDLASICQIGIATFHNGQLTDSWKSLVDPEDYFSGINVSIHGITEDDVRGAPRFSDLVPLIRDYICDRIVVSHMAFDRVAVARACERYSVPPIPCRWLDSARVARRAWLDLARRGYGLANVAAQCGIVFGHHDALEDARAAGEIVVRAIAESGVGLEDWVVRALKPIGCGTQSVFRREGNPEGEMFGEEVVFTGALSIPRRIAADIASAAGCKVAGSVTEKTTLLVVGNQDIRKLAGHDKSSKHRKAEELILRGHQLRILSEADFERVFSCPTVAPGRSHEHAPAPRYH